MTPGEDSYANTSKVLPIDPPGNIQALVEPDWKVGLRMGQIRLRGVLASHFQLYTACLVGRELDSRYCSTH